MLHVPLLSNPLGWIVLGAAGYLLYKSGKKAGQQGAEQNKKPESSNKRPKEKPVKA